MVDIAKNNGWYGRLEVYGIAQPFMCEGSIQQIAMQVMIHLREIQIQRGPTGKDIVLTIRDQPIEAAKNSWQDELKDDPNYQAIVAAAIPMTDEEIDALYHPITKDPDWPRFEELQFRRDGPASAMDEYIQLRRKLESRWPDRMQTIKDKSKES